MVPGFRDVLVYTMVLFLVTTVSYLFLATMVSYILQSLQTFSLRYTKIIEYHIHILFWEKRNSCVDYPLQLVLLIFQIKVNSIAIVRVRSVDGSPELTVNRGVSGAEGANMCSVEQVCLFILSVIFSGTWSNLSSSY
jgi:hypothetical protein